MSPSRARRTATALTGIGTLSAAFVAAPVVAVPATATAPVTRQAPVKPSTRTLPLARAAVRPVAQAGPLTAVPAAPGAVPQRAALAPADPGADADVVSEVAASGDLVAVTWPRTVTRAATATVLVRSHTGAGWQPWHTLTLDPAQGEGQRIGTDPVWEPGTTRVQVRVARADADLLRTASVTAVTSPRTDADAGLTPTAVPGAASAAHTPTIIGRAQWGADESLRPCPTEYDRTNKAVVVHHTADTNSYSRADSARMLRSIYAYDTKTLGWCDMAYNVIVDKYGQIFEGRAGGLDRPVHGAHAYAFNTDTFGVSILGNYETTAVPWAGLNALANAIAYRLDRFYFGPYGTVTLTSSASGGTTRYPAGTKVTLNVIGGHKDTSYTLCPGRFLYPKLGTLRSMVQAKLTYRNSPVYRRYQALGGATALGPVTYGESTVAPGVRKTVFTSGRRIYAGAKGAFVLGPGLDAAWWARGGVARMGQLASDETTGSGGTYVTTTTKATLAWSRATGGTYEVSGAPAAAWWANGGPTGKRLGVPRSNAVSAGGVVTQTFEHGTIVVRAGRATIVPA